MEAGEAFYDLSSPVYPQQGDIFPNVPLLSPPPSADMIILREVGSAPWNPRPGVLQAYPENLVNAFDDSSEYVVVSAERGLAAILTQTCDLVDQPQWLVCALQAVDGSGVNEGNLTAGKYANLFGMPEHPLGHFDAGFLDLMKCFTIRAEAVQKKDRIASLTQDAQHALTDKLSETLSRPWGYAPGEEVPATGKYRCLRCFQFHGLQNGIVDLEIGRPFPECDDCTKIKKRAQWHLLRKHKKY